MPGNHGYRSKNKLSNEHRKITKIFFKNLDVERTYSTYEKLKYVYEK